jgi:hypothetical protein
VSEDRAFVEGFAAAHGLRANWEGEIGFGRECVGLLDGSRDGYVAWRWDSEAGSPPAEVTDAYHKDSYIAVLGRGAEAEKQLRAWCEKLAADGVRFEYRKKDVPDLSTLVFGHTDELTAVMPREYDGGSTG